MNPELRSLINLQKIDLQIMDLERANAQIPQQISLLEELLKKHEEEVNKTKEKISSMQKERRKLEGEVEMLRGRLSKYKDQLMEVKTNKEYAAMLKEIELCKREIDDLEDKILQLMEQIEQVEKEEKQREVVLKSEREKTARQQKELENVLASQRKEIEQLTETKSSTKETIPGWLLQKYTLIAGLRKGLALAEAKDQSCQVCHIRLRPQVMSDVKKNDHIITCESCDRILYWNENSN